jgi:L-ornithine N5-oxygenase
MNLQKLRGGNRKRLLTLTEIAGPREEGDEVVLDVRDRRTGAIRQIRCDLVFLGTGFVREMPAMVRGLATSLGLSRIDVTRNYRLVLDEITEAACYLQGVNEATHGIADSLLSVLAHRATDITRDVLALRAARSNGHAGTAHNESAVFAEPSVPGGARTS